MILTIPDDVAAQSACSSGELMWSMLVGLVYQGKLTLGQAAAALGMSKSAFMNRLAEQGLSMPYSADEAQQDLDVVERLWASDGGPGNR